MQGFRCKCIPLIKAICNKDKNIKPKIFHDIFFINLSKDTIYHIYDDRGCDVIASSIEVLRYMHKKYKKWILEYDKEAINRVFQ